MSSAALTSERLAALRPWPFAAKAQQGDRVRYIGVFLPYDENDPLAKGSHLCVHACACELALDQWP
jgi:hypothetical protein